MACGDLAPEDGFDCDQNSFAITGGYVIGMGGSTSSPTENACSQSSLITSLSGVSEGNTLSLQIAGTTILQAEMPRTYNSATLLISAPDMQKGRSYAILKNGSSINSGTLSSSAYVNGSSTGGGPGGGPGGGF